MAEPIKISLLHHKTRKWTDYVNEYSDLKTLAASKLITVEVDSLPGTNASLGFAQLPESVRRLLFFAKPDLLICMDDGVKPVQPIFAIDVTEHVAARDHWIQRFPNLVGCAQEGVPGAFVAPSDMPNRTPFRGTTDPFFFFAYDRVVEIHQTPIYIAEWPSSDGEHLDGDDTYTDLPPHDAPDMQRTLSFLNLVIDSAIKGRSFTSLMQERLIVNLRNHLRGIGYRQLPEMSNFKRLMKNMPKGRPLSLDELKTWIAGKGLVLPDDLPDRIKKRDANVVFSPLVDISDPEHSRAWLLDRIQTRGGDPYTQLPLVFDYLFCRLGPSPLQRDANLVIDLTVLKFEDFAKYVSKVWGDSPLQYTDIRKLRGRIPIYTLHLGEGLGQVMKNFVRIYAFSADIIVFQDGLIYF
jgi:hypothetical protein